MLTTPDRLAGQPVIPLVGRSTKTELVSTNRMSAGFIHSILAELTSVSLMVPFDFFRTQQISRLSYDSMADPMADCQNEMKSQPQL